MLPLEQLSRGARVWLEAAEAEAAAKRPHVAFEAFRQAAELAGKALLLRATGSYPQTHSVAGPLKHAGLIPTGVEAAKLHRLVSSFTLGTYGFHQPISAADMAGAKSLAKKMVAALDE